MEVFAKNIGGMNKGYSMCRDGVCRSAGVWERGAQKIIECQEIAKEALEAGWHVYSSHKSPYDLS